MLLPHFPIYILTTNPRTQSWEPLQGTSSLFSHLGNATADGSATFADSPISRLADVPPMDVVLVDEGDAPGAAGETAIIASAGAVANALADAIGYRAARVPVRPADVLAFLRAGGRG